MPLSEKSNPTTPVRPRIIIHGGAGNITRSNLPPNTYKAYRTSLLSILHSSSSLLSLPGATALDIATHAVTQLETNALFNAGHGAVYTSSGTHELEASVMVSRGYRKRGVGVMNVSRVRHPIKLAREMLIRGEEVDGGGAEGHCQISGPEAEKLAEKWGLEMCRPSWYWSKRRWDEHRRGLGLGTDREAYERGKRAVDSRRGCGGGEAGYDAMTVGLEGHHDPSWDGEEYLPQGTVGCVVLDGTGTLCVATSTGGLTNKLSGRIGDTPTLGAGFWAEEWIAENPYDRPHGMQQQQLQPTPSPLSRLMGLDMRGLFADCLPGISSYHLLPHEDASRAFSSSHGVAMSGTGNGDSFLRLSAVRTAAAMTRFAFPPLPLQWSVTRMAGPEGMLQQSAEDRWHKTGEGEGGIIGIEFALGEGRIVADFNCGGMFRVWVDDQGREQMMVFREYY